MAETDFAGKLERYDVELGQLRRNWGWLLGLGVLFTILGLIGLGMTFSLTIASVMVFGILLIVGGGAQLVQASRAVGWQGMVLHLGMAALYVITGIVVVVDPFTATGVLTLVLAAMLLVAGVLRIGIATRMRRFRQWLWPLVSGALSVLLGTLIFFGWPSTALWVIGMFVALELLLNGIGLIAMALAVRQADRELHKA